MKNIIVRIFSAIVLLICIVIPAFAFGNYNTEAEKVMTPIISEELGTLSEITPVVATIQPSFKMYYTFEEKLSRICVDGNYDLLTTTTEPVTEVKIIEEPTYISATSPTQPSTTKTYTTIEKETETEIIEEEELATIVNEVEDYEDYSGEYASAWTVWNYLRGLGLNKAICCGIIGNMMSECGGHTLALEWWCYDNGYYGICQWHIGYCPEVYGADLMAQLNYLGNTIRKTFNDFGFKYYQGFNYEAFCQIDNYYDAAIAFAKCYERCAAWTYNSRTNNAYKAYQYFVG